MGHSSSTFKTRSCSLQVLDVLDAMPDFDYWKVVELVRRRNGPGEEGEGEGPSAIQVNTKITIPTAQLEEHDLRLDALRDGGVKITLKLGDIVY